MGAQERWSKLRWLAILVPLTVLGCDPAAETDAGSADAGFDAEVVPDSGPGPDPALTITPELQDFGEAECSTDALTFTVTNSGAGVSGALSTIIGGGDAASFELGADTCAGATLAPSATCTVGVSFDPTDAGPANATLTVSDGSASATATLDGSGATPAPIRITPTPRDFGSTSVGTATAPTTFTVENPSSCAPTGFLGVIVGGADASQFTLGVDNCTGTPLVASGSCTVEGIYDPTTSAAHAATIEVTASPGGMVAARISGSAAGGDRVILLPGLQDFGSVLSGASSPAFVFTLRNVGGGPTGTITHTFGGADAAEWSVVSSTCASATLAGGALCTITARFDAGVPGAKVASLDVTDGGLTAAATLTATSTEAPPAIEATPATVDFGSLGSGCPCVTSPTISIRVRNAGSGTTGIPAISITGPSSTQFMVVSNGCTAGLGAGASCIVTMVFVPTTVGLKSAVFNASASPGGSDTADMIGNGLSGGCYLALSTSLISFGRVAETESADRSVNLLNVGACDITGVTAVLSGPEAAQYAIVGSTCGATLAGLWSCVLDLRFTPSGQGSAAAFLEAHGSSPSAGSPTAALTGTGIADLLIEPDTGAGFGIADAVIGSSSARVFRVTNQTTRSLTSVTIVSPPLAGMELTRTATTCTPTLPPSASCTITVTFAPTGAPGPRSGPLTITGSGGATETVTLTSNAL